MASYREVSAQCVSPKVFHTITTDWVSGAGGSNSPYPKGSSVETGKNCPPLLVTECISVGYPSKASGRTGCRGDGHHRNVADKALKPRWHT